MWAWRQPSSKELTFSRGLMKSQGVIITPVSAMQMELIAIMIAEWIIIKLFGVIAHNYKIYKS